jgi:hypothetical protein
MLMTLKEQCASCKANWDGHCINGNDTWKSINSCNEVICEDYEKVEGSGWHKNQDIQKYS